jgi:hypothetical protein
LALIAGLAWCVVLADMASPTQGCVGGGWGNLAPLDPGRLGELARCWSAMTVAMMLPCSYPGALAAASGRRGGLGLAAFLLGCVSALVVIATCCAGLQWLAEARLDLPAHAPWLVALAAMVWLVGAFPGAPVRLPSSPTPAPLIAGWRYGAGSRTWAMSAAMLLLAAAIGRLDIGLMAGVSAVSLLVALADRNRQIRPLPRLAASQVTVKASRKRLSASSSSPEAQASRPIGPA